MTNSNLTFFFDKLFYKTYHKKNSSYITIFLCTNRHWAGKIKNSAYMNIERL